MFKEYDVVCAKRDINDRVLKGVEGTILLIYDAVPVQYEIEFMDKEGNTVDVLTVYECDIELVF